MEKKIPLPKNVYAKLEKAAKAEGLTPDEKASQIILKKTKSKAKEPTKSEEKKAAFPVKAFVNPWSFIHLKADVLAAFETAKGQKTPITVDLKDGSLIIKKA